MYPPSVLLYAVCLPAALARDITFPPIAAIQRTGQFPLSNEDPVDIVTGSQYNGLTTFAHIPYVNCFTDDDIESKSYDIAFMGAPFDTVPRCPIVPCMR